MQWDSAAANLGFSTADAEELYLPVDPSPDAPTVREQDSDDASMLSWVRAVLALRADHAALHASGGFAVLAAPENGRSLVVGRVAAGGEADDAQAGGERLIIALNPGLAEERIDLGGIELDPAQAQQLLSLGELHIDVNAVAQSAAESTEPSAKAAAERSAHSHTLVLGPQSFGVFSC
jgi:maltose alpha-D-glucosyltransferase/alpha-amylase